MRRVTRSQTSQSRGGPSSGASNSNKTNKTVSRVKARTKVKKETVLQDVEGVEPTPAKVAKPHLNEMEGCKNVPARNASKMGAEILNAEMKAEPSFSPGRVGKMFVGAHVSAAGGVHNAVENAHNIGCKSFALFLKSQRQWNSKPLESEVINKFKAACQKYDYQPHLILPHGSYLINCGAPNPDTLEKSRNALVEELKRCEQLGLTRYNFHPGSTCGLISIEKSVGQIAECINNALDKTSTVMAVIENMSCQGHTLGGKFEELAAIIKLVKYKDRIGVCLDTCHAFAAGFNIATDDGYEDMMLQFDRIVGLKYLKAMHINDSKGDLGCHLDRHELLGKGKLGKATFARVMNDKRLVDIPLILETPGGPDVWNREINLMYSLQE